MLPWAAHGRVVPAGCTQLPHPRSFMMRPTIATSATPLHGPSPRAARLPHDRAAPAAGMPHEPDVQDHQSRDEPTIVGHFMVTKHIQTTEKDGRRRAFVITKTPGNRTAHKQPLLRSESL